MTRTKRSHGVRDELRIHAIREGVEGVASDDGGGFGELGRGRGALARTPETVTRCGEMGENEAPEKSAMASGVT